MCQIFAGQDPNNYESVTRSVRLAGHATSIRLEATFWRILDDLAAAQGLSTPRFLSMLYDEVLEQRGSISNFASLLRVGCALYLSNPDAVLGQARAELFAAAS